MEGVHLWHDRDPVVIVRKSISSAGSARPGPPAPIKRALRCERRRVVVLVGGHVVRSTIAQADYAEVWLAATRESGCGHIVLDVGTRARVRRPCPDCVAPRAATSILFKLQEEAKRA